MRVYIYIYIYIYQRAQRARIVEKKMHMGLWLQTCEGKRTLGRQTNTVKANTINTTPRSSVTPTCFSIKFCHPHGVRIPNLELASLVFLER